MVKICSIFSSIIGALKTLAELPKTITTTAALIPVLFDGIVFYLGYVLFAWAVFLMLAYAAQCIRVLVDSGFANTVGDKFKDDMLFGCGLAAALIAVPITLLPGVFRRNPTLDEGVSVLGFFTLFFIVFILVITTIDMLRAEQS
jgi:hypothetical protein